MGADMLMNYYGNNKMTMAIIGLGRGSKQCRFADQAKIPTPHNPADGPILPTKAASGGPKGSTINDGGGVQMVQIFANRIFFLDFL